MKAVVAAFNQEKALVGAFSVITNLRMELFEALIVTHMRTVIAFCGSFHCSVAGEGSVLRDEGVRVQPLQLRLPLLGGRRGAAPHHHLLKYFYLSIKIFFPLRSVFRQLIETIAARVLRVFIIFSLSPRLGVL